MKMNLFALAAAMLALTAAAAQASPATVLPDTGHAIVKGTKTIVGGTYHGVAHQVGNVGYAAKSTVHSVGHGVRHGFHRHHHYYRHHHYSHHHAMGTTGDTMAPPPGASMTQHTVTKEHDTSTSPQQ